MDVTTNAQEFLNTDIEAAGIFASEGQLAAMCLGALGGATVGEAVASNIAEGAASFFLGNFAGEMISATSAAMGMKGAEHATAEKHGTTPAVLVAVTKDRISIMDWNGNAGHGTGPTREIIGFDRDQVECKVTNLGATEKVHLTQGELESTFSGGIGALSSGHEGKKAVLKALGESAPNKH
jgi:hypothetical protein